MNNKNNKSTNNKQNINQKTGKINNNNDKSQIKKQLMTPRRTTKEITPNTDVHLLTRCFEFDSDSDSDYDSDSDNDVDIQRKSPSLTTTHDILLGQISDTICSQSSSSSDSVYSIDREREKN